MATSQEYMQQLEQMGSMPNYRNVIADAYKDPVLKPITQETQNLEKEYLPTMFKTFSEAGTGPADMSAAAKLSMVGRNLGNISSRVGASKNIQDFYNAQIGQLANTASQDWQLRQQKLKDLQQMAFQKEEADRAEAARQAAARAARAAAAAQTSALSNLYGQGQSQGGIPEELNIGTPQTLEELNALRASTGKPPVSQEYWKTTYEPGLIRKQGGDPYAKKGGWWGNIKDFANQLNISRGAEGKLPAWMGG